MKYITPCKMVGRKIPPGADHKQDFPDYRMSPGVAWRQEPDGSNVSVEVSEATAKKAEHAWVLRWVDGRTVVDFHLGETIYSQPTEDDPRAKDRELGGTRKRRRSKFMESVQRARAEEAERQGKELKIKTPVAPRKVPKRVKRLADFLKE